MSWAFELLGLGPDADAADVKRAYARLLRTKRPDEDPEAFQQLHTAYKTALAQVDGKSAPSHPVALTTPRAEATPGSPATSVPPASPSPSPAATPAANVTAPVVHLGSLAAAVVQAAVEAENANALLRWLQSRPEFWSIQVKNQAGHVVLQRLFQRPQAISAACMDALLQFFDLDHVLSGVNPIALQNLRARQRTLWELLPQNHHDLARRIGCLHKGRPDVLLLRKNLALLQKPMNGLHTVQAAMQSGRGRSLANLVRALSNNGRFDELPPSLDRSHALFWFRAASPGPQLMRERFTLNTLRAGIFSLITVVIVVTLGLLTADADGVHWADVTQVSGILAGSVFALWLLIAGCWWFDQWQGMPESTPTRWPWLRRLAIPVVCAANLAIYEITDLPFTQIMIAMCFVFGVRRLRRRVIQAESFSGRFKFSITQTIWIAVMVMSALARMQNLSDISYVPFLAVITFAMSIADLWSHRAYLHPKLARN